MHRLEYKSKTAHEQSGAVEGVSGNVIVVVLGRSCTVGAEGVVLPCSEHIRGGDASQLATRPQIRAASTADIRYNTSAVRLSLSPSKHHLFLTEAAPEALKDGVSSEAQQLSTKRKAAP